jgi:hypothetical protein
MSNGQPDELQQLREELRRLEQRLAEVDRRLASLSPPAIEAPPKIVAQPARLPPPTVTEPAAPQPPPIISVPPVPKEPFEVRLGTYWLPRIGMAVLLTGMVFLVTWSYRYMGAAGKVALSYACCAALGGIGLWLDKRMPQFARILQAGALALTYFVTYAAHFVDAFRVIESPALALSLLVAVVAAIVIVAQKRQSATLAGMALFFGYYTSIISGVATFTLAANAVLAAAALFFLWRNRWVTISYGAVLATYLAYMIWVWRLNRGWELDRLIFDRGYLAPEDFQLRAAFLCLYWLLFAGGGLIVRRDSLSSPERNGLFTLNNAFFFLLFSLLMHHAYLDVQWRFQFLFAGVLLVFSSLAFQRFKPDRGVMDTLFVQGLAVATLGLVTYFKGVRLVAVLALESALLLVLARWMQSRWVAWIARAAFAAAALYAWDRYPNWDSPMIFGVAFAAAVGFLCARVERKDTGNASLPGLFFALVSTALAMSAGRQQFALQNMPWVWTIGAVVVAGIAAVLRVREIGWAAHLPLLWAQLSFFLSKIDWLRFRYDWNLAQSLALAAVTFGFGIAMWARARAQDLIPKATGLLRPYAFLATAVVLVTTIDVCPERWRLAVLAGQMLTLVIAGVLATEPTFLWLAVAAMIVGALGYLGGDVGIFRLGTVSWANATTGLGLFVAAERVLKLKGSSLPATAQAMVRSWIVIVVTALGLFALRKIAAGTLLTVSWAGLGFVLLALGFAVKERPYRVAGLVALAFSLMRAVFYDLARLETLHRILSFIGLGVILLVLAFLYAKNREKIAKWL